MKAFSFLFVIFCFLFSSVSCNTQPVTQTTEGQTTAAEEIWDQGIYRIFGTVISVQPQKDAQIVVLKDKKDVEYRAMVSPKNLGERAFQYRIFTIGEEVGFSGTLNSQNEMKVIEILETH